VRISAIGIAKADVVGRSLKGAADGIVVGHDQRRRLTPIHEQDGEADGPAKAVLNFRPTERRILAMLLKYFRNNFRRE